MKVMRFSSFRRGMSDQCWTHKILHVPVSQWPIPAGTERSLPDLGWLQREQRPLHLGTARPPARDRQDWILEGPSGHWFYCLFVCFVGEKLFVVSSRKCLRFPSNFQLVLPKLEKIQLFPDVKR